MNRRPLIWTSHQAAVGAAGVVAWLASIELGTSRTASKAAANTASVDETVVDTTTSKLFDLAASAAIAGGLVASLTRPAMTIRSHRASYFAGLFLVGASGLLSTIARHHLGRFHRDSLTVHADHELVETGPYRWVRHPLYTSTIGVFLGFGCLLGNWASLTLAALPAGVLVHRLRVEEDMLIDALGSDYGRYRQRTARLLPRVW